MLAPSDKSLGDTFVTNSKLVTYDDTSAVKSFIASDKTSQVDAHSTENESRMAVEMQVGAKESDSDKKSKKKKKSGSSSDSSDGKKK